MESDGTSPLHGFEKDSLNIKLNTLKDSHIISASVKDHICTKDGQIFYPCQFCNKVFPIKHLRSLHLEQCSAKEYILSVDEVSSSKKIDIQQNIILNKQMDVNEILSNKAPPIKITIRRSPGEDGEHFTVTSSVILKDGKSVKSEEDFSKTKCRTCGKDHENSIEMLRHWRTCQKFPKVVMAFSEVKKFYSVQDRTKCPICLKPQRTAFRSAFVKHLQTHTNEMRYSCQVCKKKFRRMDHKRAHEKRHF